MSRRRHPDDRALESLGATLVVVGLMLAVYATVFALYVAYLPHR